MDSDRKEETPNERRKSWSRGDDDERDKERRGEAEDNEKVSINKKKKKEGFGGKKNPKNEDDYYSEKEEDKAKYGDGRKINEKDVDSIHGMRDEDSSDQFEEIGRENENYDSSVAPDTGRRSNRDNILNDNQRKPMDKNDEYKKSDHFKRNENDQNTPNYDDSKEQERRVPNNYGIEGEVDSRKELKEMLIAESKLSHAQKQLVGLLKSLLYALSNSEDLAKKISSPDRLITPVEAKKESALSLSHYEFARNNLLNNLSSSPTKLMLAQRPELPPLAKYVQQSADELYDPIKDHKERKQLQEDCEDLVEELSKVEWKEDEANDIIEMEEQRKREARKDEGIMEPIIIDSLDEEQDSRSNDSQKLKEMMEDLEEVEKKRKRVDKQREKMAEENKKSLEELIAEVKEQLGDLHEKTNSSENIPTEEKDKIFEKIRETEEVLLSKQIPPIEVLTEVSELANQVYRNLPRVHPDHMEGNIVNAKIEYADKPSEEAARLLEELNSNNEKLGEILVDIHELNMIKAADDLIRDGERKDINLTVSPDEKNNRRAAEELRTQDKKQIKDKLDVLKRTVAECMECAEER